MLRIWVLSFNGEKTGKDAWLWRMKGDGVGAIVMVELVEGAGGGVSNWRGDNVSCECEEERGCRSRRRWLNACVRSKIRIQGNLESLATSQRSTKARGRAGSDTNVIFVSRYSQGLLK